MIATIIGATGLTGSFLLQRLLADAEITGVIAIARRSLTMTHDKLTKVVVSDLSELPSIGAVIRGNLWFCCLGTTIKVAGSQANFERIDHDAVVAFARIAKEHHATSLTLVSAMGANAKSRFFYNRVKGRTEQDVTALALRSLIIFRPALLVGPRREHRLAERLATATLVPISRLLPTRVRNSLITDVDTLATRMLAEGRRAAPGVHVIPAQQI